MKLLALRGATSCDVDTADEIDARTKELVSEMLARNGIEHDDIVSILFTATDDLHAQFPATAARAIGLGDVPLICAQELDVEGGMPRTIRVLMHCYTERARTELRHVYLGAAKTLRDDLPE
ncbi:MAG: chorismate mutase [Actinobacteria bacterium]|nr:chorismate mutase [Actinomycetota bacterium]